MNQQIITRVDQTGIKVSQPSTMLLLLAAFILDSWLLAACVAAVNLLGAVVPSLSLFGLIYWRMLIPSSLVQLNAARGRRN